MSSIEVEEKSFDELIDDVERLQVQENRKSFYLGIIVGATAVSFLLLAATAIVVYG